MNYFKKNSLVGYFLACLMGLLLIIATHAISREVAKSRLAQARENLLISQATEKRIATQLEQVKKSGNASPEVIKDYEIYLARVQAMVAENQKIVNDMEAAYSRYAAAKNQSTPTSEGETDKLPDEPIPEEQSVDELAALDRELDESLSEFDELLLKELDLIRAKSAEKMRDLAEEAAEAAKRLREKGIDIERSSSSESSEESEQKEAAEKEGTRADPAESGTEKQKDTEKDNGGKEEAAGKISEEAGQGSTGERKSYGGGEDDDIVARQLREAAENETDPELKEKLWKEYEAYKKNTSR
ncbi:MAG: hypothetical protein PVF56_24770 [Desulfobacterales bacterium]|jgi:hypothetical protein